MQTFTFTANSLESNRSTRITIKLRDNGECFTDLADEAECRAFGIAERRLGGEDFEIVED